jgi:hypothetical protein
MKYFLLVVLISCSNFLLAQEDSTVTDLKLEMLTDEEAKQNNKQEKIQPKYFNSTRVVNLQSVEFLPKGFLDFRILHRFGNMKRGVKDLFGLDFASMRMGLDYGISNSTTIGIGRSTLRKELDIFVKQKIFQTKANSKLPITAFALLSATRATGNTFNSDFETINGGKRHAYIAQLGVAAQLSKSITVQVNPTYIALGIRESLLSKKSLVAMGIGANYKFNKHVAFVAEYVPVFSGLDKEIFQNPLTLGVDVETGGHVFQLHLSNAAGMNEKALMATTVEKWGSGEIRFGFNLSRLFKIIK